LAKDIRKLKTERNIEQAFITLLKRKALNEITVGDICAKALTSRSTFYLHYMDKFDVLDKVFNKQIKRFEHTVKERIKSFITSSLEMSIAQFYSEIIEQKDTITLLFQIKEPQYDLQHDFQHIIEIYWKEYLEKKNISLEIDADLTARLGASIIFEILNWTFKHGIDNAALQFAEKMRIVLIEQKL
jgi:AcrR family transcriptional regulator